MAVELRVLTTEPWKAEEARIERQAGLEEFAADAEAAYALLWDIQSKRLTQRVVDFNLRRATYLIARAGTRARLAADELRGLGGLPDAS